METRLQTYYFYYLYLNFQFVIQHSIDFDTAILYGNEDICGKAF